MKNKFLYGLLLLTFCYGRTMPTFAQCDNRLTPASIDLISYRHRQNRCEGFYVAEVSGQLEVVGFIKGTFGYELNPNEKIEVIPETPEEINIRAVGIPMTLYYRMDGRASQGKTLVWDVGDVLYQAKVTSDKVGVYGWVQKGPVEVYLPVQTRATTSQPQKDETYRIYLRSPTALSDLRWRICTNNQCSSYEKYSDENIMAGLGIILQIPQNSNGDCVLEIATMKHGEVDFDIDRIHFRI